METLNDGIAARGLRGAVGTTPSPPPYLMQASCELSQDWFSTASVTIGDGDEVVPYRAADGSVAALVNTNGTLNNLVRDAAQPSGWSYAQLPDLSPYSPDFQVAVVTDTTGTPQMVMAAQSGDNTIVSWYQWDSDAGTFDDEIDESLGSVSPSMVQANLTRAGEFYFAWLQTDPTTGAQDIMVWQPVTSDGAGFGPAAVCTLPSDAAVQDLFVMHADVDDPTAGSIYWLSDPSSTGNGEVDWAEQNGDGTYTNQGGLASGFEALLAVGWPTNADQGTPWLLAQDTGHVVRSIQPNGGVDASIGPFSGPLGEGAMAAWFQAGLMALAFVDQGNASISTEYDDVVDGPGFTQPIPLDAGVLQVRNLTSDPAEGTLFVVNADLSLSAWTKDPVSGWAQTPILQHASGTLMINAWRAELTVYDANQNPVPDCDVQITADRDIGIWQPSGSAVALTNQPFTMTTDMTGRITFSVPATDLDTAQLTVQAFPNGAASGDPFPVTVDVDAHDYLAGNAGLTDLPTPMTGQSMLDATDAAGHPLFTTLTQLSGDDRTNGANAAAAAINHLVNAGLGAAPTGNDPQSVTFDASGPVPTWSGSASPAGPTAVGSIWTDAAHDLESAYRGVRNGVIHVAKTTGTWLKDESDDAYHWVHTLYLDLDNDIDTTVQLVVTDMRSAIHAVSGLFHTLGADIEQGVEWLVHNIAAMLEEVGANAARIRGWLTDAPGQMSAVLNQAKASIIDSLSGLETDALTAIQTLQKDVGATTIGESAQRSGPTNDTGSNDTDQILDAVTKANNFINHISGRFLFDKILKYVDSAPTPASDPNLAPLVATLRGDFVTAAENVTNFLEQLNNGFEDLFRTKSAFDAASLADVFEAMQALVHDGVAVIEAVVDAVFAILDYVAGELSNVMGYSVQMVPLIGDLLSECGVSSTLTAAEIISLLIAFPATLIAKVSGHGPLFPGTSTTAATAGDPWKVATMWVTSVTQLVWGLNDLIIDANAGQQNGGVPPSKIPVVIDVLAPVVSWIFGWPGAPNPDGTTAPPFANPLPTGGTDDKLVLPTVLLGLVDPLCAASSYFMGADQDPDDPPQSTFSQYFYPVVNALASTAQIVLASLYNWATDASPSVKAAGILGDLSNVFAPFAQKWMAEETEGVSVAVKLVVDAGGNLGAAICDFDTAMSAT